MNLLLTSGKTDGMAPSARSYGHLGKAREMVFQHCSPLALGYQTGGQDALERFA